MARDHSGKAHTCKKYGIQTGETILEAQRKCPNFVLVPPNYGLYEKCSAAFTDILPSCHLFGEPVEVAELIKDHIWGKLGFTVNVGVSSNKLLGTA